VVDRLKDLGFALERLRLIVNRLDNTPAIHHNDLDRVFGIPVYLRLSDASQELENACTAGKLPDKNGDFRRQIASLARKIGGLAEEIPKRKRTPLFAFGKG
jgi:Flp pilus assembly CpaE family ATPase